MWEQRNLKFQLFHNLEVFFSLTTEQNLRAIAEILILDKSFIDIKINELISKFELDSVKKIEAKYLLVVKKEGS